MPSSLRCAMGKNKPLATASPGLYNLIVVSFIALQQILLC